MIRIKTIMAKNFKSVGNAGIRFDLKDDKREMILLDGKVGSGKSMLLSIISYNWFGKDYGAETPIDKLPNEPILKTMPFFIRCKLWTRGTNLLLKIFDFQSILHP